MAGQVTDEQRLEQLLVGASLLRVSFGPESLRGGAATAGPGQVDYRLARNSVLKEFRRGRLSRLDVCDAHPELLRAARSIGMPAEQACPICEGPSLVHVSYAFGPRLAAGGHCFTTAAELARLTRRAGDVTCYVVEVCPNCAWNHLARTYVAGRRRATSS
ncbi:MAG: hypothetical protein CYG61_01235 [Actinobacteria bacterium]|nr:MAG: hypothetical protein CYG61_01235 [Actinomycetota bacterium]